MCPIDSRVDHADDDALAEMAIHPVLRCAGEPNAVRDVPEGGAFRSTVGGRSLWLWFLAEQSGGIKLDDL